MKILQGQGVSGGIAFGRIRFYHHDTNLNSERRPVPDAAAEVQRFEAAVEAVSNQIDNLYHTALSSLGEENAAVFQIHRMILEDPDFCDAVRGIIFSQSFSAAYAVHEVGQQYARVFASMEDAYMQGRAADIEDISRQLETMLSGGDESALLLGSEPAILTADDLTPSETARLEKGKVLAFVTEKGSLTSHTSIFARTMGIPAIVGLGAVLAPDFEGVEAVVDGTEGKLILQPDDEQLRDYKARHEQSERRHEEAERFRGKPTRSKDGQSIQLFANVGGIEDVKLALKNDAEGIGLLRSEFLYLKSSDYPDEETLFRAYRDVLERMEGKRVIIRTLDIGADKQAPYFELAPEENPAMGLRAIRICLTRPEVFRTQLRAIYRASVYGSAAIMFPMITHPNELFRAHAAAEAVREELRAEGIAFDEVVPIGIMIETPAAALLSDKLTALSDFFSVGTNDLTQYTLALDRQNAAVSAFDDSKHEAVLRLIEMAAKNAHEAGIPIGICGELGADVSLLPAFLKMRIDELSVAPGNILPLRARIATLSGNVETP
jgi:phosphoenolpyruvate-protein phosphotransferase (PTS system enzyme I)